MLSVLSRSCANEHVVAADPPLAWTPGSGCAAAAADHSEHGLGYRLMRDWGGWGRDQAHWLMQLHEGEWLGAHGETIYVLLNGLGLIWMLSTGLLMLLGKWLR